MRIYIDANPAETEVLREELWEELLEKLPKDSYCAEDEYRAEKGIWEDLGIAVLSEIAAEIVGKVLSSFAKKHRVNVKIQDSDGRKIIVSYSGDNYTKIVEFLKDCVK